ncbi:MAG: hypothetical protein ACRDG7_09990 [Candidatus Limnocylindria bacterium]
MQLKPSAATNTHEDEPWRSERCINPQIAHQVLWYYGLSDGRTGYRPGGFAEALLKAIGKADTNNRALLSLGYAGWVAACDLIERAEDGVDQLREIAGGGRAADE